MLAGASIKTESKLCHQHCFDSVLMLAHDGMLTGETMISF